MANTATDIDANLALAVALLIKLGPVELTDQEVGVAAELVMDRGVKIAYTETSNGITYGITNPR